MQHSARDSPPHPASHLFVQQSAGSWGGGLKPPLIPDSLVSPSFQLLAALETKQHI